jgi:hypothetical protein
MLRRRGLITGAASLTVGLIARQAAQPVAAAGLTLDTDTATFANTNLHGPGGAKPWNAVGAVNPVFSVEQTGGANNDGIAAKANGYALYGLSIGAYSAVHAINTGTGVGLTATATNNVGASVSSTTSAGLSSSGQTYGVEGSAVGSPNAAGVYGHSSTGYGVLGSTTATGYSGLTGTTNTANTAAVAGASTVATAYAAYFTGSVVVNGPFTVLDPTQKHGAIAHPDGTYRTLYSVESPEPWLEDFGRGTLSNGKTYVRLDPDFAAVVQTDDYHVFLTPHDADGNALAVTEHRKEGFTVQERNKGTSGGTFSYRVVARPKTSNKAERMARFMLPNLHTPHAADFPAPAPVTLKK